MVVYFSNLVQNRFNTHSERYFKHLVNFDDDYGLQLMKTQKLIFSEYYIV